MMLDDQPQRFRSRTHELRPFWIAMGLYRHERYDPDVRAVEFGCLTPMTAGALLRAGFTCQRQIEACPDWLLLTVSGLGRVGLKQLRLFLPYRRDIYRKERCPGYAVEAKRFKELSPEHRDQLDLLIREVRLQLAVERALYGSER